MPGPPRPALASAALFRAALFRAALFRAALFRAALGAVLALAASVPAGAQTRDVEVTDVGAEDGTLTVEPALHLVREARGSVPWELALTNGGATTVELELHLAIAAVDADGEVVPGSRAVPWGALPRTRVSLLPGHRGDLTALLTPDPADLPAAVQLVATADGEPHLQAIATIVLWPPGHQPQVTVDLADDHVVVTTDTPVPLDLTLATRALPRAADHLRFGPLLVLPGTPRALEFAPPSSLLATSTHVLAAIDGAEVASTRASTGPAAAAIALLLLATALLALATRQLLRHLPRRTRS